MNSENNSFCTNRTILFLILLLTSISMLNGQTKYTLPEHVWRLSVETARFQGNWIGDGSHNGILNQRFSIDSYGKRYFDHDFRVNGYYANPYDLYDLDTLYVDGFNTIGDVMRYYNNVFAPANNLDSIPDYSWDDFFGEDTISVSGNLDEFRSIKKSETTFNLSYGITKRITGYIIIPHYTLEEKRSFSWDGHTIPGIADLLAQHDYAKQTFEQILSDSTLDDPFMSKLEDVYEKLYTWDSDYSVLWALAGGEDPIETGIYGQEYNPYHVSDTVGISLDDLLDFYYPENRSASGLGDVTIGASFRILGRPSWEIKEEGMELFGTISLVIPLGSIIGKYEPGSTIFGEKLSQANQMSIGKGVNTWMFMVSGSNYTTRFNRRNITTYSVKVGLSQKTSLPTPMSFLSTPLMHHDSIPGFLGDTYLYKRGLSIGGSINMQYEVLREMLEVLAGGDFYYKGRDYFWSKSEEWDRWMRHHNGFDTQQSSLVLLLGIRFTNLHPLRKKLPGLFELNVVGYAPIFTRNHYRLTGARVTLTTYVQGW